MPYSAKDNWGEAAWQGGGRGVPLRQYKMAKARKVSARFGFRVQSSLEHSSQVSGVAG